MHQRIFKANRPKIIGNTNMIPRWDSVKEIINESDVVLEVLDARMPKISRNYEIEKLVTQSEKKLIFVLNKADLISESQLKKEYNQLKKEADCFIISSTKKIGTKRLREYLLAIGKAKQHFKIGVVGYPNIGKSSLINALSVKKKLKVSSVAGTTHGPQWISAQGNLSIIDSPGVIPIDENDEVRHALIYAKNVERIKQLDIVAQAVINLFQNKKIIRDFYNLEEKLENQSPEEIMQDIGKKRGFLKKGGVIDESRTAIQIIKDWQNGKLRLV